MHMVGCVMDRCGFTILYRTITDQFVVFQLVCRDIPDNVLFLACYYRLIGLFAVSLLNVCYLIMFIVSYICF